MSNSNSSYRHKKTLMKIFLSSTYGDLITYRKRVKEGLEGLGTNVDAMEVWFAKPGTPSSVIKEKIKDCNLFVGIYAYKYGSIPPEDDENIPEHLKGCSFTEVEYEWAKEFNKPPFCFLVDEKKTPNWPPEHIEGEPGQSKLQALKTKLRDEQTIEEFTTTLDLAWKVAVSVGGHLWQEEVKIRRWFKIYSMLWQPSSELTPKNVMGSERGSSWGGFRRYYHKRDKDILVRKVLTRFLAGRVEPQEKRHLLIKGRPLAGKTRLVYEWLTNLDKPVDVLIPHYQGVDIQSFFIPDNSSSSRPKLLFLDDLQRYVDFDQFGYLLGQFLRSKDITILATCRSGQEYDKVTSKLLHKYSYDVEKIFALVEITNLNETEAMAVVQELPDLSWQDVQFDGTIGSIFLDLKEMARRFREECNAEERTLLRTLKIAYIAGLYEGRSQFSLAWIQKLAQEKFELTKKVYEWTELVQRLEDLEFLRKTKNDLIVEEVYLEQIVDPQDKISLLEEYEFLQRIYATEPEALFWLGNRLTVFGDAILAEKVPYKRGAIAVYQAALDVWQLERYPEDYARTQQYLGLVYLSLAEVQEPEEYCRLAIQTYQAALQVYSVETFSIQYAQIQATLGIAYRRLADVRNREQNSQLAIRAYQKALKIMTVETFPLARAVIQNNLGMAYLMLAKVREPEKYCRLAIQTYQAALQVYTVETFPIQYAQIQANLGVAYRGLAEVNKPEKYCQLAIQAFHKALEVQTLETSPLDYALTQNNLGLAYETLARVRETEKYSQLAIQAFHESLQVVTVEKFPTRYATAQANLGLAYQALAEMQEIEKNCQFAIQAFHKALQVRTLEKFPIQYAIVQSNLGLAHMTLAAVQEPEKNYKLAIQAKHESLQVYTLEAFPIEYAVTQHALGFVYRKLAEIEKRIENCQRAIRAFEKALQVYRSKSLSKEYTQVLQNLEEASVFCFQVRPRR
ncbi:MAG: DUF4062 domain-containing protein [Candidatus Hermodarchaeota archaeon]